MTRPIDTIAELRRALDVLSRAETERAWQVADAAVASLGTNVALRAEAAAYLLATILGELSTTTKRADLSDVLPGVEALAMYVVGRMATITIERSKKR